MTPSSVVRGYPFEVVLAAAKRQSVRRPELCVVYGLFQDGQQFEAILLGHDGFGDLGMVADGRFYRNGDNKPQYQSNPPRKKSA